MQKPNNHRETKDSHTYGKCMELYVFLLIIFAIVLIIMFALLFDDSYSQMVKTSGFQFFIVIELVIIITLAELYVSSLTVWEESIVFESWILFKERKEIPYKNINSVKTFSIFWLWGIEIYTGNDIVNRYKYLDKYSEVEKLINIHVNKK